MTGAVLTWATGATGAFETDAMAFAPVVALTAISTGGTYSGGGGALFCGGGGGGGGMSGLASSIN